MSPKNRSVVLPARFQLPLLVAGAALSLFACADKGDTDDTMDGLTGNPTASGTATGTGSATTSAPANTTNAPVTTMMPTMTVPTMTMGTTSATATVSMTATSSTQMPSASVTATASETAAPEDSATGGAGGMGASPTSSASNGDTESGGAGGMGEMNTGGSSGAGGAGGMSGGDPDADVEITAEDFTCIADWPKVLGFRITNIMGHEDEAVAVAEAGTGKYPVGTIIQHLPTEAMVKHKDGFSPETRDWEFFLLAINSGTTMITTQGTTDITTMGNTCASCHDDATEEYDFVLNTYQADGNMLAFDFPDSMLDSQIASDPRCP